MVSLGAENPHPSRTEGWGTRSSIVDRVERPRTSHRSDRSAARVMSGIVEYFNGGVEKFTDVRGLLGAKRQFTRCSMGRQVVKKQGHGVLGRLAWNWRAGCR